MKRSIIFALGMMVAAMPAMAFERPGMYSFNSDAWMPKKVPEGHSFLCKPCQTEIRVQITYGPRSDDLDPGIVDRLADSGDLEKFIQQFIRDQIPVRTADIEITRSDVGDFFGLRMIQFHAIVTVGNMVARDTTFLGVHRNRMARVTVNYADGDLTPTGREALNEMMSSLEFQP